MVPTEWTIAGTRPWRKPCDISSRTKNISISRSVFSTIGLAGSDEGIGLRGYYLKLLQTEVDSLTPQQVATLVSWSLSGRMELSEPIDGRTQLDASEIPTAIWKSIAQSIHQRWNKTTEKTDKHLLGDALQSIYSNRFSDTELLPFLRERIKTAADDYKGPYIAALFETLLTRNWSDENEQEAFQLLPQLSPAEAESQKLLAQVPALYRLVDAMISGRQAAADRQMHDEGKVNELTRTELAKKKAEFAKSARIEVAKRLGEEAAKLGGPLAPWLRMEQAYLDVQLDQNLPAVEEMCWKLLGEVPPKSDADAAGADTATELTAAQLDQQFFDALLRQRAYATVMNLAAAPQRHASHDQTGAAIYRRGNRTRGRLGRAVAGDQVPTARGARSARRIGKAIANVDSRRREHRAVAQCVGDVASRARQARRGNFTVRSGGKRSPALGGRLPDALGLVFGDPTARSA